MEVKLNIEPIDPPPRTLADVAEFTLCFVETRNLDCRHGSYYRRGTEAYRIANHVPPVLSLYSPSELCVREVKGKLRCTRDGDWFNLAIEPPEGPEPRTLADVEDNVVCKTNDGLLAYKHNGKVMNCCQHDVWWESCRLPRKVLITKVLGRISITWEPE